MVSEASGPEDPHPLGTAEGFISAVRCLLWHHCQDYSLITLTDMHWMHSHLNCFYCAPARRRTTSPPLRVCTTTRAVSSCHKCTWVQCKWENTCWMHNTHTFPALDTQMHLWSTLIKVKSNQWIVEVWYVSSKCFTYLWKYYNKENTSIIKESQTTGPITGSTGWFLPLTWVQIKQNTKALVFRRHECGYSLIPTVV